LTEAAPYRTVGRMKRAGTWVGSCLAIGLSASCAAGGSGDAPPDDGVQAGGDAGTEASTTPDATTGTDAPAGDSSKAPSDPFAPQPDESEGLSNVAPDVDTLLEHGALAGACDKYKGGQTDRKTMLLCGKWMYFYETFGTAGMPAAILKFLAKSFPDELGLGFSKLGLVLDPTSADSLPLGIAPTAPIQGNIDALAFTCASCHMGKLPDGRYAVGAPNHDYDYAKNILAITLTPILGTGLGSAADHDPDAVAKVQPVLDKLAGSTSLATSLGLALLPLASIKQPAMTKDIEHAYATWPLGTQDFVIAPLPIDDGVNVVGKMIGLWGIPRPEEQKAAGMATAMLGWAGDAPGLDAFVKGFAALGGVGNLPTDDAIKPLLEYIYSLRAPANPTPPEPALVQKGAALYASKGCAACHDGPRGSGKRMYGLDEVGTDHAIAKWADPSQTGTACCGLPTPDGGLTHAVKSPRMVGMWTQKRFLHNGSLATLEQLFCMGGARPAGTEPLGTAGHTYTCDGLTDDEKGALLAFLRAH
jgi:hypothetical protein